MSDVTIFIKENGPAFVSHENGAGLLNEADTALAIKAFGPEPRRIDLTHEELKEALDAVRDA